MVFFVVGPRKETKELSYWVLKCVNSGFGKLQHLVDSEISLQKFEESTCLETMDTSVFD